MLWHLLIPLLVLQLIKPTDSKTSQPNKALQFGSTWDDYVEFYPDMRPMRYAFTICAWGKKGLEGSERSWISYTRLDGYPSEIDIADDGSSNSVQGWSFNVRSRVSVPLHTWTHQCNTWRATTGNVTVYYNGTLIGSYDRSTQRPLIEDGYFHLGHKPSGWKHREKVFGGQLMKLNIFGKEMTAAEVAELYNGGKCSEVERKYEDIRHITWESILKKERYGKVYEVDSDCPADDDEGEDEEYEEKEEYDDTLWDMMSNFCLKCC